MFLHPHTPEAREVDGLLFRKILSVIGPGGQSSAFIYPVLAFTLLLLQAIMLTRFINNQYIDLIHFFKCFRIFNEYARFSTFANSHHN